MSTTPPLVALILLAAWSLAGASGAPDPNSPLAEAVRSSAGRAAANFITAAEEMPAAKYSFKPTPAQMSFGEVIAHMAAGNDTYCSSIGGVAAPKRSPLAPGASKEQLVARLRETFKFCESALAGVDDSRLNEQVPYFGDQPTTRAAVIVAAAEEWAGHYSQIAVYLRLNGVVPPSAKRRPVESSPWVWTSFGNRQSLQQAHRFGCIGSRERQCAGPGRATTAQGSAA